MPELVPALEEVYTKGLSISLSFKLPKEYPFIPPAVEVVGGKYVVIHLPRLCMISFAFFVLLCVLFNKIIIRCCSRYIMSANDNALLEEELLDAAQQSVGNVMCFELVSGKARSYTFLYTLHTSICVFNTKIFLSLLIFNVQNSGY